MAADTVTANVGVIEYNTSPARGSVTVIAGIATLYVSHIFTDRDGTIVTTLATASYSEMINNRHFFPIVSLMTKFTFVGC